MNIDEKMEEMRRRMEERSAKAQSKMDNLMNKYGLNSSAGCPPPPPSMPTFSAPPIPTVAPPMPASCACDIQFCPSCGNRCDADAMFCMNCGARLAVDNVVPAASSINIPDKGEEQPSCPVDFEDFLDCHFRYRYMSGGEETVVEVVYEYNEDEDDAFWCIDGEITGIDNGDFRGCEDIHDCGVVIAKKIIDDNDGEVMMSFGSGSETFTDVAYEIELDKNLNYFNDNSDTVYLTLYANQGRDLMQTYFYELDEEDFENIKEAIENDDVDDIRDWVGSDFYCNETLDLWDDEEEERLNYEVADSDGNVMDEGDIHVAVNNVFGYRDVADNFAVTKENHPKYLLVTTDSVKRAYATFELPANFSVGGISFIKNGNADTGVLDCNGFGDYVTGIQQIRYAGETYCCDDCGDAGTCGDIYYFLFEWNDDNGRYTLVAQSR